MSARTPRISFSLPVYNAEPRLEACLQSIRRQDYPADRVEILVADGGSTDATRRIASRYGCRLFDNPRRLADEGAKIIAREAAGELLVTWAADNELADRNGLKRLAGLFARDSDIACAWGPMIAGPEDPSLNRYYALIRSDPLSWFVNRNLERYLRSARRLDLEGGEAFLFDVDPARPLIWGANGLTYRTDWVRPFITVPEFMGDNDVFQALIESGRRRAAYCTGWRTVHHHVETLGGWSAKWRRDFVRHFLEQRATRNMRWIFDRFFAFKLAAWTVYVLCVPVGLLHAVWLALRDQRWEWLWHPAAGLVQWGTYLWMTAVTPAGRLFLKDCAGRPFSGGRRPPGGGIYAA